MHRYGIFISSQNGCNISRLRKGFKMFTLLVIQYFIQYRVQPQNIWTECKMFRKAHNYIQLQASIPNLLTILRLLANWPCSKFSDISTKFIYMAFTSAQTKQYFIDSYGIHITKLTVCKYAKKISHRFSVLFLLMVYTLTAYAPITCNDHFNPWRDYHAVSKCLTQVTQ